MEKILEEFYFDNYDLEKDQENICLKLVEIDVEQLLRNIQDNRERIKFITAANIPQFSNLTLVRSVLQIISDAGDDCIDYEYIGEKLNVSHSQTAKIKYGENHLKLAIQMGLVLKNPYRLSNIGKVYLLMKDSQQEELNRKLYMKIPIIQQILVNAGDSEKVNAMTMMKSYLAAKTAERRRGNVRKIFIEVLKDLPEEKRNLIMGNVTWNTKKKV